METILNKESRAAIELMVADGIIAKDTAERYFPELKESEGERIRKEMIEILKNEAQDFPSSVIAEKSNSWIAWLEKQGEQKHVEGYNITGIGSKHAEGKLGEMIKNLKPAWSENDVRNIQDIDSVLFYDKNLPEDTCIRLRNWLKSLKYRVQPQPKQDWSEEDEEIIRSLLDIIYECHSYGKCALKLNEYSKLCEWLKSLKGRYTWKPSDEQMKVLNEVLNFAANHESSYWNDYIFGTLNNLIRQLKKLREE